MGKSLTEVAQELKKSEKKVQLIYAFNGIGKTRLSREFKELVSPKQEDGKVIYYNAFTEDLFSWDNKDRKLKINENDFTPWVLADQGQDQNIADKFHHYTSNKLTPHINEKNNEISFSIEGGNEKKIENIKISKGEESCYIWCIFYNLITEIVEILNKTDDEEATEEFANLEYIFIDDPVSSLDENHLIELGVNIADLIKSSRSKLKFIITTHNPLFYNVLHNELSHDNKATKYKSKSLIKKRLDKFEDGTFSLIDQSSDSPFSYHLYLLSELDKAISSGDIKKYHFNFLRNILEKTATFLGYKSWKELLPNEARQSYYSIIINLSSHSKFSGEEISIIKDKDKNVLGYLVKEIKKRCSFNNNEEQIENSKHGTI